MARGTERGVWNRPRIPEGKDETIDLSGDRTIVGLTPGTLFGWIESSLRHQRRAATNNAGRVGVHSCGTPMALRYCYSRKSLEFASYLLSVIAIP